jgi:pimeloyl-ACP methyl ester carboxylesterase
MPTATNIQVTFTQAMTCTSDCGFPWLAIIFYYRSMTSESSPIRSAVSVNSRLSFKDRWWHRYLGKPYRLHVNDHGGSGPVVILLHGLASSSANWVELIPLLKDTHRCISVDLLGFGDSPKPQWCAYTMDDHLRAVQAAIRRLRLRQPFTLVGHSLGSLLATRYARDHAADVDRLVLLSPPVYAPLHTIASRAARQRTSLYLRAYSFLRTHKRFTPENIQRLSRIIPQVRFILVSRETWKPFIRSLEQCIEHQTLIADISTVKATIDIFYGVFDELIVPYNIRQLAKVRDVRLYPLRVNHVVGKRYSLAVAKVLLSQEPARRT